jgi:hypothetical protein
MSYFRISTFYLNQYPFPNFIANEVKLPAHKGGASRRGYFIHMVPLDPAYPASAGRGTSGQK